MIAVSSVRCGSGTYRSRPPLPARTCTTLRALSRSLVSSETPSELRRSTYRARLSTPADHPDPPSATCAALRCLPAKDAASQCIAVFFANPHRAKAQMEGALIMAMSNIQHSEVSFAEGKVVQSNVRDYGVTRMRAAPRVGDVHLLASEGARWHW